jgi:hypothetical protein
LSDIDLAEGVVAVSTGVDRAVHAEEGLATRCRDRIRR